MEPWMSIWTYVFFISITAFALMSVWVVIFGGIDVLKMLSELRKTGLPDQPVEEPESSESQ
ncbi:MAG: hypothetical protein JXR73_19370 [Candidatus Omnitrophica bacterium]|nr:hypothetical protein [Candidatus Omnitrophota bacterium]